MSPETAKIVKMLAERGYKYVKAALEKDAQNRYSLKEAWTLPIIKFKELPPGEYNGPIYHVFSDGPRVLVWLSPYESTRERNHCDGATGIPDRLLGIDFRQGAAMHDPGYDEMDDIAKAFGVPVGVVRKLLDKGFVSVVLAENKGKFGVRTITTIAYWVVRAAGGIYHDSGRGALKDAAKNAVIAACAALLLGGCGGCVQTSFEDPRDYTSPAIEKTCAIIQVGNLTG
jgi:hypothetical protein